MKIFQKVSIICLLVFSLIIVGLISINVYAVNEEVPLKFKLPHADNIGDPLDKMLHWYANLVEEASFGDIQIEIYGGGQLGATHAENMESCALGVHPLVKVNLAALAHYSDIVNALELPFLFKNREHVAETLSGPLGDKITEWVIEETGIRVLAWFGCGFQSFYTNKPIKNIEDIQGVNMRVMDSPARKDSMNSYGARAILIDWQEAYGAFQQGIADGGENAISLIYTSRQYEILPYISDSNHFYSVNVLVINEEYFQSLTAEQQNILTKAAELMESYGRKLFVREEKIYTEKLIEEGVNFVNLEPGALEDFKNCAKEVWKKYADTPQKKEIIETITGADL